MSGPWHGQFAMRELGPGLVMLRADSTSWPSPGNVVVVLDPDGAALIDCGFGTDDALEALEAGLKSVDRTLESVHTVLCTHPHVDHAGGAAALSSGRRVLVPAGAGQVLADPAQVARAVLPPEVCDLAPWLAGFDVDRHFQVDCGATALPATWRETQPWEVIELGGRAWTAVPTPGHDAHLMCYWEQRTRMLVYSDLLVTHGTAIPWYAPGGGGTEAYLASLRRVAGLGAELGVSGHGGVLAGADTISASAYATADQISGRTSRISAALAAGPVTFAELERCVYPPIVHDVIPWASSVAAVHLLEQLESGAARRVDDGYLATRGPR